MCYGSMGDEANRIGAGGGRLLIVPCQTATEADELSQRLLKQKLKRGYQVVDVPRKTRGLQTDTSQHRLALHVTIQGYIHQSPFTTIGRYNDGMGRLQILIEDISNF